MSFCLPTLYIFWFLIFEQDIIFQFFISKEYNFWFVSLILFQNSIALKLHRIFTFLTE